MAFYKIATDRTLAYPVTDVTTLTDVEFAAATSTSAQEFAKSLGGKEIDKKNYHLSVSPTGDIKTYYVSSQNLDELPSQIEDAVVSLLIKKQITKN